MLGFLFPDIIFVFAEATLVAVKLSFFRSHLHICKVDIHHSYYLLSSREHELSSSNTNNNQNNCCLRMIKALFYIICYLIFGKTFQCCLERFISVWTKDPSAPLLPNTLTLSMFVDHFIASQFTAPAELPQFRHSLYLLKYSKLFTKLFFTPPLFDKDELC